MTDNPRRRSEKVREKKAMEEGKVRGGSLEREGAGDGTEEEIDTPKGSAGKGGKTNLL